MGSEVAERMEMATLAFGLRLNEKKEKFPAGKRGVVYLICIGGAVGPEIFWRLEKIFFTRLVGAL